MTPLQIEFYARIGKTLLEVQLAEQQFKYCLSYFLRAGEAETVEGIEAMAAVDRKKSLGKLVEKIRERIVIEKGFDDKLTKFIDGRNEFAHSFLRADGVNLHTDEGLKKGIELTKSLSAQANEIRKTIQGLLSAIEDAPSGDDQEDEYKELAKVIFGGQ
jgi:hypothetical protein